MANCIPTVQTSAPSSTRNSREVLILTGFPSSCCNNYRFSSPGTLELECVAEAIAGLKREGLVFNFDYAPKDKHPNPANKDNACNATVFDEAMVEASKLLNKKMENLEDAELDKEMKRQLN
ncbi:hypothetical protein EDC96DRAFT_613339 [Choanephora cucurbitarum]|nr:hypothetical protein EDC96DRAFT_613339 [Choanephora cucurbitarum]